MVYLAAHLIVSVTLRGEKKLCYCHWLSELTSRMVKGADMQWNIQLSTGCDVSDVNVGCILAT